MRNTIQHRFEQFHYENPWVYDRLVMMLDQLKQKGRDRYGIAMLWEVLRWDVAMGVLKPDSQLDKEFKLNNDYRSRYARKILEEHPEFDGLLETRALRSG